MYVCMYVCMCIYIHTYLYTHAIYVLFYHDILCHVILYYIILHYIILYYVMRLARVRETAAGAKSTQTRRPYLKTYCVYVYRYCV